MLPATSTATTTTTMAAAANSAAPRRPADLRARRAKKAWWGGYLPLAFLLAVVARLGPAQQAQTVAALLRPESQGGGGLLRATAEAMAAVLHRPPTRRCFGPRQGARPRGAAAAQRPVSAQLPRPPFTTNEYPGRGSPRLGAVAAAAAGRPHRPHFHRSCVRVGRRRSFSARARGRDGSALWPACGGGAAALPVALAGAAGDRLGQPRRSRQPAPPDRAPGPQHHQHQHQQQREHRS